MDSKNYDQEWQVMYNPMQDNIYLRSHITPNIYVYENNYDRMEKKYIILDRMSDPPYDIQWADLKIGKL